MIDTDITLFLSALSFLNGVLVTLRLIELSLATLCSLFRRLIRTRFYFLLPTARARHFLLSVEIESLQLNLWSLALVYTENAVSPLLLRARAQLGWIPNV
jgi:hypothetical protein